MSSSPEAPILTAARRLAAHHPDFTMDDLSRVTGRSRATLYRLVGSRSALIARLQADGVDTPDQAEQFAAAIVRVVAARGVDALTMDAVADEAGVSIATLYRRYGDRTRLVAAVLDRARPEMVEIGKSVDPRADLVAWLTEMIPRLRAQAPLLVGALSGSEDGRRLLTVAREGTQALVAAVDEWLCDRTGEGLLRPGDPSARAGDLCALLLASACLTPLFGEAEAPAVAAARIVDTFLHGVSAPGVSAPGVSAPGVSA